MLVLLDWDRLTNDEIWGEGTICISVPPPAPNSGGTRDLRPWLWIDLYFHNTVLSQAVGCYLGIFVYKPSTWYQSHAVMK